MSDVIVTPEMCEPVARTPRSIRVLRGRVVRRPDQPDTRTTPEEPTCT